MSLSEDESRDSRWRRPSVVFIPWNVNCHWSLILMEWNPFQFPFRFSCRLPGGGVFSDLSYLLHLGRMPVLYYVPFLGSNRPDFRVACVAGDQSTNTSKNGMAETVIAAVSSSACSDCPMKNFVLRKISRRRKGTDGQSPERCPSYCRIRCAWYRLSSMDRSCRLSRFGV